LEYTIRYEGIRWKLVYGVYEDVQQYAVNEIQKCIQKYLPYIIKVEKAGENTIKDQDHIILIGTADNNPLIKHLINKDHIDNPACLQGFSVSCIDSPWSEGKKLLVVTGYDPEGVHYGVMEFIDHLVNSYVMVDHPFKLREAFDAIKPFRVCEYPLIENRGIWTWGYVIYDYKRFLDNMAKLRLNMITVWNDCPPINAIEFVEYAHARGIIVIMGFHWGWGIDKLDPNSDEDLAKTKTEVIANYVDNYKNLNIDGIYFQTFTETRDTEVGGTSIAALASKWVNDIASGLYEIDPDLYIQFGLHATSIVDNYTEFKSLDPRVTITWEDAGAVPYSYDPVTDIRTLGFTQPESMFTVDQTIEYSKKLVDFRENTEFAIVPKGYNALRWDTDFEHHDAFIIGERDQEWIQRRKHERQPRWDSIDALWLQNNTHAARFYREILNCSPSKCTITALVEDGMFEEYIPLSVSLFAETVWNPTRPDEELIKRARK
jgi:hypothetical protein